VLAARTVAQPVRFPEAFAVGQPRAIPGGSVLTNQYVERPSSTAGIPSHYLKSGQPLSRLVGDGGVYDRWSNRG
jgi:hypothetical protein